MEAILHPTETSDFGHAPGGSLAPVLPAVSRDLLLVLCHTRLADECGGVNALQTER